MLCQTGEGCGRLVLDCMGRRVQKFKNATDPPWLDVVVLIRIPDPKRIGTYPVGRIGLAV